ncbi:PH domain-containing protein, partial [Bacillus sp. D-CC]
CYVLHTNHRNKHAFYNEQGPIMRKYNLAELHISTAATSHSIPGLTKEEAEQLLKYVILLNYTFS